MGKAERTNEPDMPDRFDEQGDSILKMIDSTGNRIIGRVIIVYIFCAVYFVSL